MLGIPSEKEQAPDPSYDEYDKSKKDEKFKKDFSPESKVDIKQCNKVTTGNGGSNNETSSTASQAVSNDASFASSEISTEQPAPCAAAIDSKDAEATPKFTPETRIPLEPIDATNTSKSTAGSGGDTNVNNIADVDVKQILIKYCCGFYNGPPPS